MLFYASLNINIYDETDENQNNTQITHISTVDQT